MNTFQVPDLEDLLSQTDNKPYPYTKTFQDAANDPIAIVYSSGTTGQPKPILWNHAIYATIDAHSIPESLDGHKNVYATMRECKRQYVLPFNPQDYQRQQ